MKARVLAMVVAVSTSDPDHRRAGCAARAGSLDR